MQTAASEGRVLLSLVSAELGGGGGARLAGWLGTCFLGTTLLSRNGAWVQIPALSLSRHLTLLRLRHSVSPSVCVSEGVITVSFRRGLNEARAVGGPQGSIIILPLLCFFGSRGVCWKHYPRI